MTKRSWVLRPVAWLCTLVMCCFIDAIAGLLCRLGIWLVGLLGDFSTIGIILFITFIGTSFCSLFFWAMTMLPNLLVSLSDNIYPSNHAFRYYFLGIAWIGLCLLLAIFGVLKIITSSSMVWFYIKLAAQILAAALMIIHGYADAKNRHEMQVDAV